MNPLIPILVIPALAALLTIPIAVYQSAARINVLASVLTFVASLGLLVGRPETTPFFLVDDLNTYLIILTTLIACTTSLFSAPYLAQEIAAGKLTQLDVRYYHAMYQAFVFSMLLALASNNLGVMWVALEGATLSTALLIGLYRTPRAIEAAWKYFILCGVGIGLALFGTTLIYLAAQPFVGTGLPAMTWSTLVPHAASFNPQLLSLAFVFLLVGYGTKVGLAPFHAWLPDAHAEGPTPISAVLSGLLLNVALFAILRFKTLIAGNGQVLAPAALMIGLGLFSLLFAGFMLYRRHDIKRLLAYSSIEHMGIMTFAFGIGGPLANFAGLLHMAMHSLTKSALFYAVGHVAHLKHTRQIKDIRGLTESHPQLGWILVFGLAAIAGLPPFGIFMSEFLIVSSTFAHTPWLAVPLVIGLLAAFGALILRLQGVAFGAGSNAAHKASLLALVPLVIQLGIVLIAGVYLPPVLVVWLQNIAHALG